MSYKSLSLTRKRGEYIFIAQTTFKYLNQVWSRSVNGCVECIRWIYIQGEWIPYAFWTCLHKASLTLYNHSSKIDSIRSRLAFVVRCVLCRTRKPLEYLAYEYIGESKTIQGVALASTKSNRLQSLMRFLGNPLIRKL